MTHYDRHYTDDKAKNDLRALMDVEEYLTGKQHQYFEETFFSFHDEGLCIRYQAAKKWLQAISFACMMVGIQGYPVRAMKRRFLAQFKG